MALTVTFDGVDLQSGNYLVGQDSTTESVFAPVRTTITPYATLPRATRMGRAPGPLVIPVEIAVQGTLSDGTLGGRLDTLSRLLSRGGRRLVIGYQDLRWVTATWFRTAPIALERTMAVLKGEFRAEQSYWQAPAVSSSIQTGALGSLPLEGGETGTAWGYDLSLTPGGAAPTPLRALFAVTGANSPTGITIRNRLTAPAEALAFASSVPTGYLVSFDPVYQIVQYSFMANVKGYWPFADPSGSITDFSTNNKDLSAAGGLTYLQDGPEFGAVDANGTTGVFNSADASFALVTDITIMGWVNADVLGTLMGAFGKGANLGGFAVWKTAGDVFAAGVGSSAATRIATGTTPVVAGQWYHVAMVFDDTANSVTLYLDGELEAQATGGAFTVGGYSGDLLTHAARDLTATIRYWNGRVTSVAVLNTKLTQSEVRHARVYGLAGYNGTQTGAQRGYWPVLHGEVAAATNLVELRATHASAAPAGRLALGWRSAYPITG